MKLFEINETDTVAAWSEEQARKWYEDGPRTLVESIEERAGGFKVQLTDAPEGEADFILVEEIVESLNGRPGIVCSFEF